MIRFTTVAAGLAALGVLAPAGAQSLYYDRTTFLADSSVGATTGISFDSSAPGTDLSGATISGATFTSPAASPLLVISGATGVRFPMSPSSGLNLLSPGGSNPALEDDGLVITFAVPTNAAGLDVIFDAPDGASYVSVSFYGAGDVLLAQNTFIPAPVGAPGYQFVGLVMTTSQITKIVLSEFDPTSPDDHVGYDSIVFAAAIPEPGAWALMLAGAPALFWARRRGARSNGRGRNQPAGG